MKIEIPEIKCSLIIEILSSTGGLLNKISLSECTINLGRNSSGSCVLSIKDNKNEKHSKQFTFFKNNAKYQLNTRFVPKGMCSIFLSDFNTRLLISNSPPNDLTIFLKGFSMKCKNKVEQTSNKENLFENKSFLQVFKLSQRKVSVNKISPLCEKDLIRSLTFKNKTNFISNKSHSSETDLSTSPLSSKSSKLEKRKLLTALENFSDTSPNTKRKKLISLIPSPVRLLKTLNANNLTDNQSKVVQAVLQGKNVFFTGSAGTGKSYLLKFIISRLSPESTFITASTGISACQIGGVTLHMFSGIPSIWLEEKTVSNEIQKPKAEDIAFRLLQNKAKLQKWKSCKCLIIDEISMVPGDYFEMLEKVARLIRGNKEPFGGIQIVVCGDFLQLPPISKNGKKHHCFQTKAWVDTFHHSFELRKIQRQTDSNFIQILQLIRLGKITSHVKKSLIKTLQNDLTKLENRMPTQLFTHRSDVEMINQKQLSMLTTKSCTYYAKDSDSNYSTIFDSLCPTSRKLELKLGAQVMLNKNIDLNRGLVNGLTGIVLSFENDYHSQSLPRIRFANNVETVISQQKWSFNLQTSNDQSAYRMHLPLQLAWALTLHKSQGMTITNGIEISLGKIFESGQAYVALSRSTSLENIKIIDLNLENIIADKDALEFYKNLKYV